MLKSQILDLFYQGYDKMQLAQMVHTERCGKRNEFEESLKIVEEYLLEHARGG